MQKLSYPKYQCCVWNCSYISVKFHKLVVNWAWCTGEVKKINWFLSRSHTSPVPVPIINLNGNRFGGNIHLYAVSS
jgi:hypothetical protein